MSAHAAAWYDALMPPYVADPGSYQKVQAFSDAVALCREFLSLNGIAHPQFVPGPPPIKGKWKDRGLYVPSDGTSPSRVFVDLKKSVTPVRTPGFSWSFPGFKADLTAVGVTAHETGHHVHESLGYRDLWLAAQRMFKHEPRVSGYEPHLGESIAEALRLFILNPSLLREGRPFRWAFATDVLGLRPLHDAPWREVLAHAHLRMRAATESWIRRGH